jgi:hypothetical protein
VWPHAESWDSFDVKQAAKTSESSTNDDKDMDNEEKDIDSEEDVEKKREKRDEIHQ